MRWPGKLDVQGYEGHEKGDLKDRGRGGDWGRNSSRHGQIGHPERTTHTDSSTRKVPKVKSESFSSPSLPDVQEFPPNDLLPEPKGVLQPWRKKYYREATVPPGFPVRLALHLTNPTTTIKPDNWSDNQQSQQPEEPVKPIVLYHADSQPIKATITQCNEQPPNSIQSIYLPYMMWRCSATIISQSHHQNTQQNHHHKTSDIQ